MIRFSDSFKSRLKDTVFLCLPLFFFLLVCFNAFVCWRSVASRDSDRKAYLDSVSSFRSEVLVMRDSYAFSVSNLLQRVMSLDLSLPSTNSFPGVSSSVVPSVSASSSLPSASVSYTYFVSGGVPFFRAWGVDYTLGSRTSYGVVSVIYPDRVFFEGGFVLVNSFSSPVSRPVLSSSPVNNTNILNHVKL